MNQNLQRTLPINAFLNSLFLFGIVFAFSFSSFAQVVSIGSPMDATEGSGAPMSFLVSLDNGAINTTGAPITGSIGADGGTATPGTDYLGPVSFSIANGSNSIGILVPILDDPNCEGTETVILVISNVNVGTINPTAQIATANIFDDDCSGPGFISIGSPVDAIEGTSDVTFDVFIEGGGVNTTGAPITGSISYSGTATGASDFTEISNFSIPVGVNSIVITVPVIDDGIIECDETVIATISALSAGTIGNASSTAIIVDDECAQSLISIGSPTNGAEGFPSIDVTYSVFIEGGGVNTTGANITGFISYSGTATGGPDFTEISSFSIPVGVNSTTITLPVIDDAIIECDETVIATISAPSVGTIGNASSTAIIVDDECSQASISIGSPVDGAEGTPSTDVSFVVSLDNGAINTTGAPIVGTIFYTGTTSAADFTTIPPTSFSIPDGANSTIIALGVYDDLLIECNEDLIATISSPSVGTIGNASSTALIIDNECSAVLISIDSPIDGIEGSVDVSFVISLNNGMVNGTGSPITGSVSYTGTATPNIDFVDLIQFSIPDGASSVTHVLSVFDDLDIECDETVIATISNPSVGTIDPVAFISTAIIIDDDCNIGIDPIHKVELRIYPNPVNSEMNFEAEQQMKSYSIVDLNGRVISNGDINSKELSLNTAFIPAGSYIIKVLFEDEKVVNKKMLKN